ncbi:hypothetical protein BKA70DRAFT_1242816 [Coprinopsis sp. MPI-PUGE-AT-0042]|nr:hypothetical protein BKA70DRAFT_1242816 [Coprinopsis sp. MPI-PUGE-AT-0042]
MNTTDMLIKTHDMFAASITTNPGEETAGTCWSDDLSPTVETKTLEELDLPLVQKKHPPLNQLTPSTGTPEEFMKVVTMSEEDGVIDLDLTLVEFDSFLKAFIPRASAMYDDKPTLTKEQWIAVLKWSTKWLFNDLRQLAISHLSSSYLPWFHPITGPVERICLVKEYRLYEWLLQGYEQLAEGKLPLRDARSDVLDAFKEELDCVRQEVALFITRSERLEEARRKAEEEARKQAEEKEEETPKEAENEMGEADMELEFQANKARRKAQVEEIERQKREEAPAESPDRMVSEEEGNSRRVVTEHEASQPIPKDEATELPVAESSGCLKDEEAKRLGQEEQDKLRRQEKRRKRQDEKNKKLQALAEEELRRRKGLSEKVGKKIMPTATQEFGGWFG